VVGSHLPVAPTHVSGVPGLMRALARELPDRHVRAVELAPDQSPAVIARLLADETLDPAGPVSVAYRDGTRVTRRVAKGAPLDTEAPALPFDAGSVIVLTGGAQGITARAALAIGQATGCRLELLGRSPAPGEQEDPRTARAADRPALRRVLAEMGEGRTPAEVEAACDRIMAAREIRATLEALRGIGCPATYHSVDVRDHQALQRVLADVRRRHGRIDAVVHGAGVLDDRLVCDKTDDGFDRVFATKVDAAHSLIAQLQHDVRLLVLFGSVSGVFGNRGQVDYSAANHALDELAGRLDGAEGRRVVSIDWGPWSGTGMVSAELEREYARRGIGLVDPEAGVRALLHEMGTLPGEPAQVVIMRAEPEAFVDRRERQPVTWPAAARRPQRPGPRPDASEGLTLEDLTERE
jgi:NAD(P)-dependent dehydrogenase (short-subunit alcohol dehydrogenase family)